VHSTRRRYDERLACQYADGSLSLKTLGQTVTVRLSDCTIQPPLSKWHALTLLHYLDLADGAPLTGRTITFSQYKDGLVRGGGLDRNAELIVRRDLGILPPEELERRCRSARRGAPAVQRGFLRAVRFRAALSRMVEGLVCGRGISSVRTAAAG